jgi:hypothetical protein
MSLNITALNEINISMAKQQECDSPLVVANPQHLISNMGGESVILSLKNGKYYGLNEVGARIWELIQQPISHQKIVKIILQEYEVEEHEGLHQINSFLKNLKKEGLIDEIHEQSE